MQTDKNLEDVHDDFGLGKAEADTIFDFELFGQHFTSVEFDEVIELTIDD